MKKTVAYICVCLLPTLSFADENVHAVVVPDSAFFAFDNGTGRGRLAPEVQAQMLSQLGYAGIGYTGTEGIPDMLKALDRHRLKMFSIYVACRVGPDGPTYDAGLKKAIQQLKGRGTSLWLTVHGGKASSDDLDEQAVSVVREIAALADESGLRVALYPHTGFYVARVEDAIRVVEKVDRNNVGVSFNLCHWLKLDDEKNMESALKAAWPHLFLVSINGADRGDTKAMGWDRLIQTLDRGDFDVGRFLTTLGRLGYDGPIGLQCYRVPGDERENLERSMLAWRRWSAQSGRETLPSSSAARVLSVPSSEATLNMSVCLPDRADLSGSDAWQLIELGQPEVRVPVQLMAASKNGGTEARQRGQLAAAIFPRAEVDGTRRFRLQPAKMATVAAKPALHFREIDDKTLTLWEGDQPVMAYNHGTITSEVVPKTDFRRHRACYIHPLWGLNGEVLTDDFPQDHYHHHGLYWAWPHVEIEGQDYDLWTGRKIQHRFLRWICREAGPVAAVLAAENGWFIGERVVMHERVWFRTHRSSDGQRSIDVEFVWVPVDIPITLRGAPGKSYGGLNLRYAPRTDTVITVPSGRTTEDLKETPLEWADMTARFHGAPHPSGAAVFVHPSHPDYPPTWLTRHYGVLCVGWPGVKAQIFEPGKPIRTTYRIWIHKSEVTTEQIANAYTAYLAATQAKWD